MLLVLSMVFVAYLVGGWTLTWAGREQLAGRARVRGHIVALVRDVAAVGEMVAQLAVVLIGMGAVILERRDFRRQLRGVGLV